MSVRHLAINIAQIVGVTLVIAAASVAVFVATVAVLVILFSSVG